MRRHHLGHKYTVDSGFLIEFEPLCTELLPFFFPGAHIPLVFGSNTALGSVSPLNPSAAVPFVAVEPLEGASTLELFEVSKLAVLHPLPTLQERLEQLEGVDQESGTGGIVGRGVLEHQDDKEPLVFYKRILLVDKDTENKDPLLLRISPPNLGARDDMAKLEKKGKALFDALVKHGKGAAQGRKKRNGTKLDGHATKWCFNLGFWFLQGLRWFGPSADLLQSNEALAQKKSTAFLHWWSQYVNRFVVPIMSSDAVPLTWRTAFHERARAMETIRQRWSAAEVLCPAGFLVCSVFDGYTPGEHKDRFDHAPSVLLNFGAHTWLKLPAYKTQVLLRPLDICILDTKVLAHATLKPAWADPSKRWACSCYFQSQALNSDRLAKAMTKSTHPALTQTAHNVAESWHRQS
ncbi:hypothetical protein CBOM_01965 [Ceraceosorus bombacis]|uniref:Uncharacterized protein n=1 Tax=Ceraceosorus bombacis TaxID=401625 RepID=A0A0P1BF40_9BASI|nr:hypothetical protein CBOM_01965 [Ceraceosorus bombacis]